jgi:two-component system, OmpR family, sensor kinase
VASPGSFIRSAARATSSAYRRLPIRWRLAGGSALLTLVILLGFAAIVGVLTTRSIRSDFDREVAASADDLRKKLQPTVAYDDQGRGRIRLHKDSPNLDDYAASQGAVIRVVFEDGTRIDSTQGAPYLVPPRAATQEYDGYLIESRSMELPGYGFVYVQYARRISDVKATANRVRVFLGLGVLAGAALALLAGLATATRAMAPITRLTDTARSIARTRDPSLTIPHPESRDEVSELATTLESMLGARR